MSKIKKEITFNDYLQEKHAEEYIDWLENLDYQKIIDYAEEFMSKKETVTCSTCHTEYKRGSENANFIKHLGECQLCDHVRGEQYDQD